jgi:hypothetical protein
MRRMPAVWGMDRRLITASNPSDEGVSFVPAAPCKAKKPNTDWLSAFIHYIINSECRYISRAILYIDSLSCSRLYN